MAIATPQRERHTTEKYAGTYNNPRQYYGGTTVKAPVFAPTRPEYIPHSRPVAKPVHEVKEKKAKSLAKQKLKKIYMVIGILFALSFILLYRQTIILEDRSKIDTLAATYAEIEAENQAIQTKIDRGLELGTLEDYATSELGMIRPDTSQVFYIDVQLENSTQVADTEDEKIVLQGTPGALIHAIRVLN